ncbi:Transcription activator of gluconeogenesis [Actinidia chinensis var. chinensis]|uniref:Transcription activator of gluconeogenesis n=1 Tax=Actinidia chinensis var. chinensis TaxID=1590841 RepID=A0A2R6S1U6_ACTCC|nr:Transcription activator of gluconeogenesis [Actinidia chinensis var. chinensis]
MLSIIYLHSYSSSFKYKHFLSLHCLPTLSFRELHLPVAWNPPMGTDELRRESSGILIDLDAVPEPPPTAVVPQIQQTTVGQSIVQPSTSSNADNWACFDSAPEVKIVVPATAPVANMSALSSASNSLGAPVGQMSSLLFVNNAPTVLPINNLTNSPPVSGSVAAPVKATSMSPFGIGASVTLPAGGAPVGAPGSTPVLPSNHASSFVQVADGGRWLNMLPLRPSLFPDTVGQTTTQPFTPPVSGSSNNHLGMCLLPQIHKGLLVYQLYKHLRLYQNLSQK